MKISGLQVDRFGILNGFQVDNLSDGITVFYGANEAGKTTLLQFVRTMFFGFGGDRNQRYLEMQHTSGILASGSRIGGSLYLSARDDDYHVRRYSSLTDPHNVHGELRVTSRDGTRQGAHRLNTLLSGIDETILNNVFAVGLRELQYLGTLNDTQAARYLYNLSTGTDRVSLVDVMRQLNGTRARLLGTPNEPGYLTELADQSQREVARIHQLARATDRWAHMRSEFGQLQDSIQRLESSRAQLQHKLRAAELALRVRPDWEQRHDLEARLEALGPPRNIPDSKRTRLEELNREIGKQRARTEEISGKRGEVQVQIDKLQSQRDSVRTRVRLEALLDQRPAIANLDDKVQRLRTEIEEVDFEIQAERERLQLGDQAGDAGHFDPAQLVSLREPAREVERAREQLEASKHEATRHKETLEHVRRELSDTLGKNKDWFDESDRRDVAAAIARTNETAARLRQRLRQQERLDQLEAEFKAVSARRKRLLKNQLLPWDVIRAMAVVFTLGGLLVLCALFGQWLGISQASRLGFTVMGLVLTGFIGMLKMALDGSTRDELRDVDSGMATLASDVRSAEEALDRIDSEIPGLKGQSLTLDDVEERLRRLESLIPLDNQRRQADDLANRHEQRAIRLAKQLKSARERWTESLQHLGLPSKLTPQQVWQLVGEAGNLTSLNHRFAQLTAQLEQAEGELSVFAKRIADTATELRLAHTGSRPSELLVQLANYASTQKQKAAQIGQVSQHERDLKKQYRDLSRALQRLQRQRRALLSSLGVIDEEELQRVLQRAKEHAGLVAEHNKLARRIAETCGSEIDEPSIAQQIYTASGRPLEERIRNLQQQIEVQETQLKSLLVRQGQASEQIRAMTIDRELTQAHLNLAVLEKRLSQGIDQLKVISAMSGMLKHVYKRYEKERQPETLQTASTHFRHMTAGRYLRIWTPLDEDILMVDDENGKSISVDQLSRGTREQVFLALRLALVAGYSGRGARMPLVLDDVLVNFDQGRTNAAAEVLVDFAQTGGQVLLFTCHQHVAEMFRSMGIDVRELPSRTGVLADVTQQPQEADLRVERARPAKRPRRRPRRIATPLIGYEDHEPETEVHEEDDALRTCVRAAEPAGVAGLYALQFDDHERLITDKRVNPALPLDPPPRLTASHLQEDWHQQQHRSPAPQLDSLRKSMSPRSTAAADEHQEHFSGGEAGAFDLPTDRDAPVIEAVAPPIEHLRMETKNPQPEIARSSTHDSQEVLSDFSDNTVSYDAHPLDELVDDVNVIPEEVTNEDFGEEDELYTEPIDEKEAELFDEEKDDFVDEEEAGDDEADVASEAEDDYEYEYIEVDDDDAEKDVAGTDDEDDYEYEYVEVDSEADEPEDEDYEYEYIEEEEDEAA